MELVDDVTRPAQEVTKSLKGIEFTLNELREAEMGVTDSTNESLKSLGLTNKQIESLTSKVEKGAKKTKEFAMEWLGVGFFGQSIAKTFGFLNKMIEETYLSAIVLNVQFSILGAMQPVIDPIVETFESLADAFLDLPEPIQGALGTLSSIIGIIGGLGAIVGFTILGLNSLAIALGLPALAILVPALGGLGVILSVVAFWVAVVIVAVAALWLAWKTNFGNIQEHTKGIFDSIGVIFKGLEETFSGVLDVITGIIEVDGEKILQGFEKIKDGIWEIFRGIFGDRVTRLVEGTFEMLEGIFTGDMEKLVNGANKYIDAIEDIWENGLDGILGHIVQFGVDALKAIAEWGIKIRDAIAQYIPTMDNLSPGFGGLTTPGVTSVNDFIMRPGQPLIKVNPNDTIMGFKGKSAPGGNINYSPTINIRVDKMNSDMDIKALARKIGELTNRDLRGFKR